jgi:divalent metal cation (Fe/Co/Zn/Cd) transporter
MDHNEATVYLVATIFVAFIVIFVGIWNNWIAIDPTNGHSVRVGILQFWFALLFHPIDTIWGHRLARIQRENIKRGKRKY